MATDSSASNGVWAAGYVITDTSEWRRSGKGRPRPLVFKTSIIRRSG